ncbi:mucosal addressin cell adhesion molecule 1 isoform X2 [Dromiciops gliroides]|uniref:mucosal addressin cell adhesion molecule 1 isoform X2 n=1 Tax=Dromiciops gliroides TaxID=33562 RepID=UPI001CC59AD3|nr:mucosal addressin cell adhesion molecule 1 isoform X2 [Dromiciops gliroides]
MSEAGLPLSFHLLLLLLLLPQGQSSWGTPREGESPLRVEPEQPVVQVGGSIQLRCSVACPQEEAMVQWKGLDTSLGHVSSGPGLSILTIPEATLSMGGIKVCISTCQGSTYQATVELLVYAFPDKVEVSPSTLVPGQGVTLICSAREVFPYDSLTFAWFRGDEKVEGLRSLDRDVEPEQEAETGEELDVYWVTERWALPAELATPGPELRCLVEMKFEQQVFSHSRAIAVISRMTSPDPSTPPTTTPIVGLAPASSEVSTVQASSTSLPDTTASSLTLGPGSSPSPTSKPSSGRSCLPDIFLSRVSGVHGGPLELTCLAACETETSVHWTQAPGRLADYQRQEDGAQATLLILSPGPWHRGLYQCQLEPGGQKASYDLTKEIALAELEALDLVGFQDWRAGSLVPSWASVRSGEATPHPEPQP